MTPSKQLMFSLILLIVPFAASKCWIDPSRAARFPIFEAAAVVEKQNMDLKMLESWRTEGYWECWDFLAHIPGP